MGTAFFLEQRLRELRPQRRFLFRNLVRPNLTAVLDANIIRFCRNYVATVTLGRPQRVSRARYGEEKTRHFQETSGRPAAGTAGNSQPYRPGRARGGPGIGAGYRRSGRAVLQQGISVSPE